MSTSNDRSACWLCRHFSYYSASRGYSKVTPGSDFSMGCMRNVWDFDPYKMREEDFVKAITSSTWCPEFDHKIMKGNCD